MSVKPRVLVISPQPFFQWRGSPIRVGFDAQALSELGFAVDLLTLPVGERKDIPGVRVVRVPNLLMRRDVPIGPSVWKALFDALLLAWSLCMAVRNRYCAIHAIEDAGIVGLAAARLTGAKFVFEKHSDPRAYVKAGLRRLVMAAYARVEAFVVRRAEAVIATGPGLAKQAESLRPRGPVLNIPDIPSSLLDAEPDRVKALRERLGAGPGRLSALYVGSFAMYQGINLLFDAVARVGASGTGVRFVVIGGTPAEIAERKAWLESKGLGGLVEFAGKVPPDELPAWLAAADILLSPRMSGINTPLKLLDYLKAGRCIVATDIAANRQILDEETAVLAAAEPGAFAGAILRAAADATLRERLGAAGRRLAETRYNYRVFKAGIEACYGSIGCLEPLSGGGLCPQLKP